MQYGSWISVSDFYLQVDAEDKDDARKKIQDVLDSLVVQVIDEDENGHTNLGCMITDVEPA